MNPKPTYSEPELLALLRQRNEKAFEYLYDHYSGALFGIIRAIVPDMDRARDLLQNVFVNIWKKIDNYDSQKGRLFTWMLNIARNAAIDEIRSRSHRDSLKNLTIEGREEQAGSLLPVIQDTGLKKILQQLREEWRILIDLAYFQGFTHEEISRILNLPLGTVKTRIRSALTQLRTLIER